MSQMLGHRCSLQFKDPECDNVLPGQGYHMVTDEYEVIREWQWAV